MILLIDNYDSFTFNLRQYIGEILGESQEVRVLRNDATDLEAVRSMDPKYIVLSPGPCTPTEAGICLELISALYQEVPILGICLGHQAIGQAFGASVVRAEAPMHGKETKISHTESGLFAGLEQNFTAGRYHSLILARESIPPCLSVEAWASTGEIMAISHKTYPMLVGLQFHPESVLTPNGHRLLRNFFSRY